MNGAPDLNDIYNKLNSIDKRLSVLEETLDSKFEHVMETINNKEAFLDSRLSRLEKSWYGNGKGIYENIGQAENSLVWVRFIMQIILIPLTIVIIQYLINK